jgi:hypothetical protein
MIEYFGKLGVNEALLLEYLELQKREEIDKERVFELRALANAIKEGTTTVDEAFMKPVQERRQAAEAKRKAQEARERAQAAANRQSNKTKTPDKDEQQPKEEVDTETGEVKETKA